MQVITEEGREVNAPSAREPVAQFAESLFRICLGRMETALAVGDFEASLQWGTVAATSAMRNGAFGVLASVELERNLLKMAGRIPVTSRQRTTSPRTRVLHVMTEAYAILGHTKLCRRWIEASADRVANDVVLLSQGSRAPRNLRQIVRTAGGKLIVLRAELPLMQRAALLRDLAYREADLVVLHVHPNDVIPSVSFGIPGGPPVAYLNHADHAFWVGGMVADEVWDIRDSGHQWTLEKRGISRSRVLAIPLKEEAEPGGAPGAREALRNKTRSQLGIPLDAPVCLTVGGARKYQSQPGLNFLEAAEGVLVANPKAWLVAVGPTRQSEWDSVSRKCQGRLLALGNQMHLDRFHAMADVYLEGMPAGSLTALLEAGLAGLPCVRAPIPVRPPNASDGAAMRHIRQPSSIADYVREVTRLISDEPERKRAGDLLQARVREVHCGGAWVAEQAKAMSSITKAHDVYEEIHPSRLDVEQRDFMLNYVFRYSDTQSAKVCLLGSIMKEVINRCSQARRAFAEAVAPLLGESNTHAIALRLVDSTLPEVGSDLREAFASSRVPASILPEIFSSIFSGAVRDGRRGWAGCFALKLMVRQPGLLRARPVQTGILKLVPGVSAVGEAFSS